MKRKELDVVRLEDLEGDVDTVIKLFQVLKEANGTDYRDLKLEVKTYYGYVEEDCSDYLALTGLKKKEK